mgnify:CR=1 FL=1
MAVSGTEAMVGTSGTAAMAASGTAATTASGTAASGTAGMEASGTAGTADSGTAGTEANGATTHGTTLGTTRARVWLDAQSACPAVPLPMLAHAHPRAVRHAAVHS